MWLKTFSTMRNFLPFQPKRTLRFSWISLILISLAVSVWAADDVVQQTKLDDSRELVKQAEKLARKGNLPEAEKILSRLVEQGLADSKAKLSLSYILLKQRKLRPAYDISFEVARTEPKNARAFALLGMVLLNFGNFKDAVTLLNNSYGLDKNEELSWFGMGMIDFYENRIQDGLNKLEQAEYLEPNDPDLVFSLAQVYARAEKYKEAAETYRKFLEISPSSDKDRRERIKGLISFLSFLGNKQELYTVSSDEDQTIIPMELVRDRPIIEVKINNRDEKLRFVLDTGSGISVISDETAQRLGINAISRGGMARAVGGDGKFDIVYGFLRSISLGKVRIRNIPVYIRKFHDDGEKVDGYVGLSLISKFLTTVDYGTSSFTLVRKSEMPKTSPEKDEIALPLRLTSSGFLSGEVLLHGIESPLNFIVDTGASISVISNELASSDSLSQCLTDEKMRVVGAAGITENVKSFMLPKVTFGKHSRDSIKAVALNLNIINEASGFEQSGILGGNFLKNYSLTFDFQRAKVTFVPIKK